MRDAVFFRRSLGHENRQICIAGKVARATNTVHQTAATDVGRIHITVNVEFNRGVDGNHAQTANQAWGIGNVLWTQHDFVAVFVQIAHHAFVAIGRHGD